MIVLINIARLTMVGWALYSLLLIFAPALLHQKPSQTSGVIQFLLAYGLGYLLDRLLGAARRRRAARAAGAAPATDTRVL